MNRYRAEQLAPLELKSCHAGYLLEICACPGISQEQLSRRIYANKSNVARQLATLEESGYVERRPGEEDRRVMRVYPTERALAALEQVGLGNKWRHKPMELSGGQQQRGSIARALVGRPSVILADEPTGALDSRTGREVLAMLQDIHRQGNTVVLITHDNSIAVQAQRIIRLEDGKVVYDGPSNAPEAVVTPRIAGGEEGRSA